MQISSNEFNLVKNLLKVMLRINLQKHLFHLVSSISTLNNNLLISQKEVIILGDSTQLKLDDLASGEIQWQQWYDKKNPIIRGTTDIPSHKIFKKLLLCIYK